MELDFHGVGLSRKVSVMIDGQPAAQDVELVNYCQYWTRVTEVALGLHCVNANFGGDVDVAFDDLRVIAR